MRIKVIEARQLEGNDINPVIRVTVGNKKRQTRVRQSTNRPYFNQVSQRLNMLIMVHAKLYSIDCCRVAKIVQPSFE